MIPYNEIATKYKSGLYTITQLAKAYNIHRNTLSKYFNTNGIKVDSNALKALQGMNECVSALIEIKDANIQKELIAYFNFKEPELIKDYYLLLETTLQSLMRMVKKADSIAEIIGVTKCLKPLKIALENNLENLLSELQNKEISKHFADSKKPKDCLVSGYEYIYK